MGERPPSLPPVPFPTGVSSKRAAIQPFLDLESSIPMDNNPLNRRWYVAYHPETRVGVVRSKDPAGLEEWRRRAWAIFPSKPDILDVTAPMGELLAQLAPPSGIPVISGPLVAALVMENGTPALRLRTPDAKPFAGEVADVSDSVRESIGDLARCESVLFPGKKRDAYREGYARFQATLDQYRHRFFCWTDELESEICFPDPGGPVDGLFMWDEMIPFGAAIGCACGNCGESKPLYVLIDGDVREGQELATDGEGRAVPARPGDVVVAVARTVVYPHPSVNHPPGAYIEWVV